MTKHKTQRKTQGKTQQNTPKHTAEGNTTSSAGKVRCWCFTLHNYTEADILYLSSTLDTAKYAFQEEVCPTTGTPHLQGMIYFDNARSFSDMKRYHSKWNIRKTKFINDSLVYVSKDATRPVNGRQFIKGFKIPKKLKLLQEENLYPFQKDIFELVKGEPDDRSIIWIWEDTGDVGKTAIIKFLLNYFKEKAYYVSGGKANDITFQLNEKEEDIDLFLMNIPRQNEGYVSYNGIEQVKDGLISSSKYKGGYKLFNPPHVVIMANFFPDITALSKDRWHIYKIIDRQLILNNEVY